MSAITESAGSVHDSSSCLVCAFSSSARDRFPASKLLIYSGISDSISFSKPSPEGTSLRRVTGSASCSSFGNSEDSSSEDASAPSGCPLPPNHAGVSLISPEDSYVVSVSEGSGESAGSAFVASASVAAAPFPSASVFSASAS